MRVKTEAKRESILEIASQVFQEMGYERTSMDEIAARMGGSKVTLYGYFPSKQHLFLEVANYAGMRQLGPAFDELVPGSDDLPRMLRRFGEKFLSFVCTPEAAGTYRMVVAQSGQSDIGRSFFELGPKRGEDLIAAFLQSEMDSGRLKKADASIAAMQLSALLTAETQHRTLMGVTASHTRQQIKQMVDRAVAVFMDAYTP
ncbi:TetR/AcrR family transcriptional regulator [Polaromonas sp. YR568]|uniref:TetR/AcrR family transcriptional regulator n=1 Tax=Polaromonas sp. YR568 TaxID=1855301 RepID=UPI00398C2299